MIFFCNFALIMRQRFFQPVISLLFATLLMTGCGGKGSVKPLNITLDSIVIDTTATLEKGDVCKVHLKLHLFKGPHAAALNDTLGVSFCLMFLKEDIEELEQLEQMEAHKK